MRLLFLVFLGVLLVVGLALAGNRLRRGVVICISVAICVIAAIVILSILNLYSTEQLVENYADNVASAFGVSPLLAKAAAFALLLPAGVALTCRANA
jgi:hypothetical protein